MAYVRPRRKSDANQGALVAVLRERGWHVVDISGVGGGFPDLIAVKDGRVELCEIKNPHGLNKTHQKQQDCHAALLRNGVMVKTLRTVEDAVRL